MSKNLTRKGIAFGAAFALGSTLLAGAPAFAAVELNLEPNAGTEYTMIEGETFTLKAFGNNEFLASNGSQLRVKVKNVAAASFGTFAINGVALDDTYVTGTSNGNSIKYSGSTLGTVATVGTAAGDTAVLGLGVSNDGTADAIDAEAVSAMTSPFTLSFTNSTVVSGTPEKLEVSVWADTDNDGVVDTGETVSPTRTVTFIDAADVKPAISATAWAGATSFAASVTLGDVNEAQLVAGDVGLLILNNAGTPATPDAGVTGGVYKSGTTPAYALNTAKTAFTVTVTNEPATDGTAVALATTGTSSKFTLRALFKGAGTPAATDVLGAESYLATLNVNAARANATNSTADVVASANAAIATAGSAGNVRLNSEFQVRFTAKDGSSPAVAVASTATTATFASSATLSATKYVTVNGTDYKTNATLEALEVAGVTDAKGQVTVTIKTTGFVAEENVAVTFAAEGATDTVTATAKTATYSLRPTAGVLSTNDGYAATILAGGTYAKSYVVADQFGFAPANGSYNVTLSRAAKSNTVARTTAATWSLVAPVVDGKATFNITDNGAGAGTDVLTATLVGGSTSGSAQTSDLVYAATAAAITPAVVTITDNQDATDSNVRLNSTALPSWNYLATNGAAEPTLPTSGHNFDSDGTTTTSDAALTISGIATNASNVGIAGIPVTISAKGITFVQTDNINEIYSRDSITVLSGAAGSYSVTAYSDAKGGSVVFTAAAGTVSATTTIIFDQGVAKGLAITAPANSAAGRVVDVVVTVTDASGQAVSGTAVTLKSTGAGYLNSQSGTTDATGEVISKLIVGVSETGTATVSVTATIDGVVTTKSVTITIGGVAGATVAASGSTGKFYVSATGAANRTVVIKVGGKFVKSFVPTSATKKVVVYVTSAGNKAVTVFVGGKLALTKTVTVK